MITRLFHSVFFFFMAASLWSQQRVILGNLTDALEKKPIEGAVIKISNSPYTTSTDRAGNFTLLLPEKKVYKLIISHLAFQPLIKELVFRDGDSIRLHIELNPKSNLLDTVPVLATHKLETLVAKPDYSIFDFDFYEDKLILLATERSLSKASVQLADYSGKLFASYLLPKEAGEALHFFHDYEGYTDLICREAVFRIDVANTALIITAIPKKDFEKYILPVADTLNSTYYYNDNWDKYPLFRYYYLKKHDSLNHLLNTVSNSDLMKLYNLEYYYLPPHLQLEARRTGEFYNADKHIIAALMSGFTQSIYYEPLYAPLFILGDTICIFNHYNDHLYHYNKQNLLIDSVAISYHHPKNWREWKKQLFVDETENKVYAFFSKDGHHYLKNINYQTGRESGTYKLQQHSAEKIRIKDGFVYYVYRPFGSTQERFLYRERIE